MFTGNLVTAPFKAMIFGGSHKLIRWSVTKIQLSRFCVSKICGSEGLPMLTCRMFFKIRCTMEGEKTFNGCPGCPRKRP